MAQERKLVFGALIETEDLPIAISNIMAPGRLKGMIMTVGAADLVTLTPGSCLLPDGVIVIEDQDKQLLVSNSSFPADYTLLYQLEDSRVLGGSPAILRILPGILKQVDFTDGCILGWIKYPGGSIPLADSHFIQPASIRVESTQGTLTKIFLPPFMEGIRAANEHRGSSILKSFRLANLSAVTSQITSFGGVPSRILGATVTSDTVTIPASNANYDTMALKKVFVTVGDTGIASSTLANVAAATLVTAGQTVSGPGITVGSVVVSVSGSTVVMSGLATVTATGVALTFSEPIFTYDTRAAFQGTITGGVPKSFNKVSLPTLKYIINPQDTLKVETAITGSPANAVGEINVLVESPASSGNWQEDLQIISGESTHRILNISPTTLVYNMKLPFVITGEGQPRKLITRLNVDFNCLVTFKLFANGQYLTLDPVSGTVANTGGLITREFNIPNVNTVIWTAGETANVDVSIQAQPGGSASLAHISLTLESAPFLLFI